MENPDFKVKIEWEKRGTTDYIIMSTTSNGYQWNSITFHSIEELKTAYEKMVDFIIRNK